MGTASWWLLQARLADGRALHPAATALATRAGGHLQRAAWSAQQGLGYAYLQLPQAPHREPAAWAAAGFARLCPAAFEVRASPLAPVFEAAGASAGSEAKFHYVVEMDPDAGWMPELSAWYDSEHMPGLAAVPGCVRAMRFINSGHGPLSLACYDLVSENTLGSPPWLAVRATAWSSRVRPHFTHTRRTMFRVCAAEPEPSAP